MPRHGVSLGLSLGVSPRESFHNIVDVVQKAEDHGFDSVFFTDVPLAHKDCYIALALCALNTTRIRLGTGVTNPVTREPATTANAITGIHELSRGRAILGLGAGYSAVYPVGLGPAPVRQVEETIRYIRALCRGEEYMKNGLRIRLATAQGPVPILVAASQPKMLRLAGKLADGVILMGGANAEFTRWQLEHVRQGAEEAGRPFAEVFLDLWFALSVARDREAAMDEVRPWVVSQADTFSRYAALPSFLEPFRDEIVRAGRAYERLDHLSRHAKHKDVVSDTLVTTLAVVGTPADCVARLRELAALGIHRMTLALPGGGRRERLRVLAEEVMPHLRAADYAVRNLDDSSEETA
jgi:5,10-methylenetetrahydromethanopterin reductase